MKQDKHCRARRIPAKPIDLCSQGPVTEERLRTLLAAVYDRFLVDLQQHRAVAGNEDEDLAQALENCYFADGKTDQEGRRPPGRLTRVERLIRLAHACRFRISQMRSGHPIVLTDDLELLDALADIVNGASDFEWRIDRDCRIRFV
jgi:hypothetical protein